MRAFTVTNTCETLNNIARDLMNQMCLIFVYVLTAAAAVMAFCNIVWMLVAIL